MAWKELAKDTLGLSYAEVARVCDEVLKDALIHKRETIGQAEIHKALTERRKAAEQLRKNS